MNSSETEWRWDPVERRRYRLTTGPGGTGIRIYDPDRPPSAFPPPRTSSRDNPLALSQQPSVTQARPAVGNPRPPQSANSQPISRTAAPAGGRGTSGYAIPPQPVEPYGAARPPSQYNQSGSLPGTIRSLTAGVDRLNISDTRPNVAQQGSRQQPPAARTSGYQAVGGSNYLNQAQTNYHSGYQDSTHRQVLQNQTAGWGGNFGPPQPPLNPTANPFIATSQAGQVSSSQPNYTYEIPYSPYSNPQAYNPVSGPGPQNLQSPYLQPATRPSVATPTVAPVAPVATGNGKQRSQEGSPPAGVYKKNLSNYEGETVEDNITSELVRGTQGSFEPLDHSFQVVVDHWRFFVVGRVFKYLSWEPQGHGKPTGNSIQKYTMRDSKLGQQAFAKVYRYVVVRARPKQGYSMCLRISTHEGRGTVGKLMVQSEHSIIYIGEEAPKKFPEERKLNKDSIRVIPANDSEILDPASRVWYAKPYPIEHNVKVSEVGMVTKNDIRKLLGYYQMESGYETEREPQRRTRRESSSSMSKEPEKKGRREPKRDNRR